MKWVDAIKSVCQCFSASDMYPNEILDLENINGRFYITYKIKMMPHSTVITLTEFLNCDEIIAGVSPIEVRALTQLECYFEQSPVYCINAEKFNEDTKTYEILLKHRYITDAVYSINVDDVVPSGLVTSLSSDDAFKLGYSYALRRNTGE